MKRLVPQISRNYADTKVSMLPNNTFLPFISLSRIPLLTPPSVSHSRNNLFSSSVPSALTRPHNSATTNAPFPWAIATVTSRPTSVKNDEANADEENEDEGFVIDFEDWS